MPLNAAEELRTEWGPTGLALTRGQGKKGYFGEEVSLASLGRRLGLVETMSGSAERPPVGD